jgi:hypothetical protein
MQQDFSWKQSARHYIELYEQLQSRTASPPAPGITAEAQATGTA